MARPIGSLILLLLAGGAVAQTERNAILDRVNEPAIWGLNIGGEFPGAEGTVSPVEGALQITYDFTDGGNYLGAERGISIASASAITLRFRQEGTNGGFVRIQDATGQEHAGNFDGSSGEWREVVLPLDAATFGGYWHGANDGVFHFPLMRVLVGISRGPTATGSCTIDDLGFVTSDTALFRRVAITSDAPGNVLFTGEPGGTLRVAAESCIEEGGRFALTLQAENWRGEVRDLLAEEIDLVANGVVERTATLPVDSPDYWRVTGTLAHEGEAPSRTIVGVVVNDRPANFGRDDPDSFFAIQHTTDGARTERLGVKWVRSGRDWQWGEMLRGTYWLPDLSGVRGNHQLVMYCTTAYTPPWAEALAGDRDFWVGEGAEERIGWWKTYLTETARQLGPDVACFEIQNEPDLTCMWQPGLSFEKGLERYLRILESGAEALRAEAPATPIAGIDVSGGDYDQGLPFSREVLRRAPNLIDIYTGHPYAGVRYFGVGLEPLWPGRNEERRKCVDTLDMVAAAGGQRFWIGEKGWGLDVTADPLSEESRQFAACLVQSMVTAHSVPGVERYFWFLEEGCNEGGYEYGLFRAGQPLPAAVAYGALANALHAARPIASPELGGLVSAHLFASEETGVATLVAWSEDEGVRVALERTPGPWSVRDITGRETARVDGDAALTLTLGKAPRYLRVPLARADELLAALRSAKVEHEDSIRLEAVYPSDTEHLTARVRNLTREPRTVSLEAAGASATLELGGEAVASGALAIPGGLLAAQGQELTVAVASGGTHESRSVPIDITPVPRHREGLAVRAPEPTFRLDSRDRILPSDPGIGWSGPEDLSADVWLTWDGAGLHVSLAVHDERHVVVSDDAGGFWQGDSLQVAIDPANDAGSGGGFMADDREFGVVLGPVGPRALETYPATRPVDFAVNAEVLGNGVTSYHLTIPWEALGIAPRPGLILALDAIVNDNDGEGRGYWIGITPGIGEGKRPSAWRDLFLAE